MAGGGRGGYPNPLPGARVILLRLFQQMLPGADSHHGKSQGAGGRCESLQAQSQALGKLLLEAPMGSLLAELLGGAVPEELVEAHGDAGQEADVLLEVHLAVLVVVQVVHEPLELGIIHLLLWREGSGFGVHG